MARPRKPFLMRASSGVMAAVERLAAAELRSVNAQVETLLREALARRGIVPAEDPPPTDDPEDGA
ncbi:MAG: toxin-antitoxin system HicB family antitoxin [Alphaproteobacteria bacterium]|nr:toxin-antitoxin system HicB family antitoxin [Alphaproteobacteria bacterium]MBU2270415.1 toxin-antitoxin system HicB family antitoxin [Alphaproteobacteria bacterium]MBU2419272.1 toxin-antitoxin system HicB family antitoxin [Alphaproteobacteria bacterium]